MKTNHLNLFGHIFSFLIPFLVAIAAYACLGIYPGGSKLPITLDLKSEQLAYYNYFNSADSGNNTLAFQSMGGLGGSTLGSLEMCCGPLFLISKFVDTKSLPYAIWFMIVFLTGLCGLFMYIYLRKGYPSSDSVFKSIILSGCYALCSCTVVFFIVPVWIIGIMMLPVAALSLDVFLKKAKVQYIIASLALTIILNYYVSYIIFYFLVLYFVYRTYIESYTIKSFFKKFILLLGAFLSSVFISAFSWLPALIELLNGKGAESRVPNLGFVRNPLSVFAMLLPVRYSGLNRHDLPSVYCGTIIVIFLIVYFLDKKIKNKEKIASAIFLLYLFLSFTIGLFDISWMLFKEPNGYPSRYSFVFSFVAVLVSSRSFCGFSFKNTDKHIRFLVKTLISVLVIGELFINARFVLKSIDSKTSQFADADEYSRLCDTMDLLKEQYNVSDSFSRTVKNWNYACNDGLLFGYQDIDYFSSSYNSSLHEFLGDLGFNEKFHLLKSIGITPPVASVLGVSKLIWYGAPLDEFQYIGSLDGLDVYNNNSSISFAYAVPELEGTEKEEFGENPFENINRLIEDFSGSEDVFDIIPVNLKEDYLSVYIPEGKELWVYFEPVSDSSSDIHDSQSGSKYIYYDGYPIAAYANDTSPYCVKLGTGAGEEVYFTYDGILKNAYAAVYNPENASIAYDYLRNRQATGFTKTKNGFGFYIDLPINSDIIITYPFEKGYEIYVDGIETDYYSYRNALIRLKLEAGEHIISVEYHPPGLKLGIIISLLSVIICLILLNFSKIRPKN